MFDGVVTPQMLGPVVPAVLEAVGAVLSIRRGTTTSGIAGCAVVVAHGKQVKRVGINAPRWIVLPSWVTSK